MHQLHTMIRAGVLATAFFAAAATAGTTTLGPATITSIGSPNWEPQGITLFSAPIGTGASGYAEFMATQAAILPEPYYTLKPGVGVVQNAPHAGPYGQVMADGGHLLRKRFSTKTSIVFG